MKGKSVFFWGTTLVFLFLLALHFLSFDHFPNHFMWDLDQIALIDVLGLRSHKIPSHISHPGFGMYLYLQTATMIGYITDQISLSKIWDIENSPNPLPAIIELTRFLRAQSFFLTASISIVLPAAFCLLIRPFPKFLFFSTALLMGTHASVFLQATLIRSELYAVFWWSLGVFCWAYAWRYNKNYTLYLFGAVLMGLGLMSKIQLFFHLFLPLLMILALQSRETHLRLSRKKLLALNALSFITLLVLFWISAKTSIPYAHETFADSEESWRINPMGWVFLLLSFLMFLVTLGKSPVVRFLQRLSALPTLLVFGILLSLLLHYLMPLGFRAQSTYLLYDFMCAFFRSYDSEVQLSDFLNLSRPEQLWHHYFPVLSTLVFVGILSAAFSLKKRTSVYFLAVGIVFIFITYKGIRLGFWRDHVWYLTANLATLFYILQNLKFSPPIKQKIFSGVAIVFLGSSFFSLSSFTQTLQNIGINYSRYGFRREWLLKKTYYGVHENFIYSIGRAYGFEEVSKKKDCALRYSFDLSEEFEALAFLFPNLKVNSLKTSLLCENFRTGIKDSLWTIKSLPAEDEGALLIPLENASLRRMSGAGGLSEHSASLPLARGFWIQKNSTHEEQSILFYPRNDFFTFIAMESEAFEKLSPLTQASLTTVPDKTVEIEIAGQAGKDKSLQVYELKGFTTLRPSTIGPAFAYLKIRIR